MLIEVPLLLADDEAVSRCFRAVCGVCGDVERRRRRVLRGADRRLQHAPSLAAATQTPQIPLLRE